MPQFGGGVVVSAAPRGVIARRVGELLIPHVMGQVGEAAKSFESRWTLTALKRVDTGLHRRFTEQQDLYHHALITGSDREVTALGVLAVHCGYERPRRAG